MRFIFCTFIALGVAFSISYAFAEVRASPQAHFFTVRDSIEMARFADFDPKVEFSPNQKYFAIVTSRGVIRSNAIESTIWVFKTGAVQAFLAAGESAKAPMPRVAARWETIPRIHSTDSYEPAISDPNWSPDSKSIVFLAQNSKAERQLCRVDLVSSYIHILTPYGYDVTKFSIGHASIIYEATRANESFSYGDRINAEAYDITNSPLSQILFPQQFDHFFTYSELWIHRTGRNVKITNQNPTQPLHLMNSFLSNLDILSVSPNDRSLVVLLPVRQVPIAWGLFEPEFSYLRINPQDSNVTGQFNTMRPSEYTLIDINTGHVTPLVNAPNGWSLGYAHNNGVVWSRDENKLLLMNTFLPLEGVDTSEKSKRIHPCIAAVMNIQSKEISCVIFDTSTGKRISVLLDGAFQGNDVILHFLNLSNNVMREQRYHHEDGSWQLVRIAVIAATTNALELSVAVKQDLNTPPSLWVTNLKTRRTKKLWDPNQQLAGMNLGTASVFHWKDTSGHKWIGGLVKPPDYVLGKRYPLVIQTHGFDKDKFMSDGAFPTAFAARPLASAGIIVLQMPTDADHEVTGREATDQIRGFESAITQLVADGLIDPHRIGIIGFSRTCYYVESAIIKHSFTAAAITDGVDESYMQYLLFEVGQTNREEEQIYGTTPFGKGLATWVKEAPGFTTDRIQTPLLIGAIGPSSILSEWELYASLRMQKKPVEFVYIPDGQHILQKPLDRMASQQGNVDWFRFWLQGYEDPDPAKAAQYRRWEQLRKLQQANEANAAAATNQ